MATSNPSVLSDPSCEWMSVVFNLIEGGAEWPRGITQARAAFLVKDPKKVEDPYSYRVFLILSAVYLRCATLRLQQMASWISEWAAKEMYAGVQGRDAQDAWNSTVLEMEDAFVDDGRPDGEQQFTECAVDASTSS